MTELNGTSSRGAELLRQAQARQKGPTKVLTDMSQDQVQKLVHELQTNQIELEMQNEELRKAQEELIEARDRYFDLYDFAPWGYLTVNAEGLILEANLTLAKMLGIERQTLLKQPLSAFVVPEDRDVLNRYSKQSLAGAQRKYCQLRVLTGNDEQLWVELDSRLTEAHDRGDAQLRMGVSSITERKQSQDLIRFQRDLAQGLNRATDIKEAMSMSLDAALKGTTLDSGGVYLVDRQTGDLNLICSRGLSPEFVAGVSYFKAGSPHARLVMAGNPIYVQHRELSVPLSRAEQDEGLRMMAFFPVRAEDRLCVCLNVASHSLDEISISEREVLEAIASQIAQVSTRVESEQLLRESEEKYRLLVDHSPVMIVLYDVDGNILFMNERANQSVLDKGFDPCSTRTLYDILHDQERTKSLLERHRNIIESGEGASFEDDVEVSGEVSWYWSSVQPLKDANGSSSAVQVVSYDITERKQIEHERKAAKKLEELRFQEEILNTFRARMVKAERLASVGTLSAMVAHQLSQPLTVARLSVENAMATAKDSLDPVMLDLRECLGGIEDATKVVKLFRTFARHSTERCCNDFEVLALVSRVHKLLQRSCVEANVVIEYEQLASIPTFHWYEKELEQLVYILMENAIQAAPGDSPQRLIISGRADTGGLQLSFADTCGGILETHEARIFEPFFTTKMTHENTGLGLCVVARTLEDLGGRIVTQNHPGEGVTFHVSLPLADTDLPGVGA